MEKSELQIVYRNINELVTPDYNPRKITPKERREIQKSLETFGFVEPLVINTYEGRENIVIGGNQRLSIAKNLGMETAPCVEVCLDETKEKELNLRLNKNQAQFDFEALVRFFDRDMMLDVGFSEKEVGKELSDFDKKFNSITNENCEMPIVQKFNESYHSVVIFVDNELDLNWIKNVLRLERSVSYKNKTVGDTYVMGIRKFQEIWEEATEKE